MKVKERRELILERARTGRAITAGDLAHLCQTAIGTERRLVACAGERIDHSVSSRLELFKRVADELPALGLTAELSELWNLHLPLARVIAAWAKVSQPCICGIVGLPGSGKTTLTAILQSVVTLTLQQPVTVVSLDDFYFTPKVRQSLGFKWRAMPGTHDLSLLGRFLAAARGTSEFITIPRYETRTETRLPEILAPRPRLILLEGWFVGARVPGYEVLAEALDFLIYVDMEMEIAHRSRLLREERIRLQSNNALGMSPIETESFWREAILPTATKWVLPLKSMADLILKVGEDYRIREVG